VAAQTGNLHTAAKKRLIPLLADV